MIPHPEDPPRWYRERDNKPSPIEAKFSAEFQKLAGLIETEQWFGDKERHHRYRVDFILKDVRLIIELDGHEHHSSPEQKAKDDLRTRYLTLAGYTVIRFTGGEIHRNAKSCVEKVRRIYKERKSRSPVKRRVMYVDYAFLDDQIDKALVFLKSYHAGRVFSTPSAVEVLANGIDWLHERSFVTVFIFVGDQHKDEAMLLDGSTINHPKGEMRINVIHNQLYSFILQEHATSYTHLFDDFYLVGDDRIYILGFAEVFDACDGKILRCGNEDTTYAGSRLAKQRWQRLYYPICATMGLELHEM
jgi:hypothetical protein